MRHDQTVTIALTTDEFRVMMDAIQGHYRTMVMDRALDDIPIYEALMKRLEDLQDNLKERTP